MLVINKIMEIYKEIVILGISVENPNKECITLEATEKNPQKLTIDLYYINFQRTLT